MSAGYFVDVVNGYSFYVVSGVAAVQLIGAVERIDCGDGIFSAIREESDGVASSEHHNQRDL